MAIIGRDTRSQMLFNQFKRDIDLIEQNLPEIQKEKILMWSMQGCPTKIMQSSMKEYFEVCVIGKDDLYSETARTWSNKLSNLLKNQKIDKKLIKKLQVVVEAFDCLSKTFGGKVQKDKDLKDEDEEAFENAEQNYLTASKFIKEIYIKGKDSEGITEQSIWDLQNRLNSPQACSKEESTVKKILNDDSFRSSLPPQEEMLFDLEI